MLLCLRRRALCATAEEWWELVQKIMAANVGMHLEGLFDLLQGALAKLLNQPVSALSKEQLLSVQRAEAVLSDMTGLTGLPPLPWAHEAEKLVGRCRATLAEADAL